ncbi:MAG: TlpA disulfide reductase family protein [Syntrophobacteraceae bacterium]|nr:TlpA family protein disulfide reductase [Desulfobacteraceae bacterium]
MPRSVFRWVVFLFLAAVTVGGGPSPALSAGGPPAEGGVLPEIRLPIPHRPQEKTYLGLQGEGDFTILQTRARIVILEVFSMYCPFCQKEAPVVNELFRAIDGDPELREKIKIIGIGAGNSIYEVNAFRDLYRITFPLFPDVNYSLHKSLGGVGTPYFIAVQLNAGGGHKVIYSKVGSFGEPKQFLDLLLKKSEKAVRPPKKGV